MFDKWRELAEEGVDGLKGRARVETYGIDLVQCGVRVLLRQLLDARGGRAPQFIPVPTRVGPV